MLKGFFNIGMHIDVYNSRFCVFLMTLALQLQALPARCNTPQQIPIFH